MGGGERNLPSWCAAVVALAKERSEKKKRERNVSDTKSMNYFEARYARLLTRLAGTIEPKREKKKGEERNPEQDGPFLDDPKKKPPPPPHPEGVNNNFFFFFFFLFFVWCGRRDLYLVTENL